LPAGKISADELATVEGESQLWYTLCQVMGAPKGNAGFSENLVFIYLLEHPFFFGEKIQRIIQARAALLCLARYSARNKNITTNKPTKMKRHS
jgi:hypothetical protein